MRCEAAVGVIAGHELRSANRGPPRTASGTFPAWNYGGDDYISAEPNLDVFARAYDSSRDFMSENQRQRMPRWNAVVREANIRVADSASGHLHNHFIGMRLKFESVRKMEWPIRFGQRVSKCVDFCHGAY
jgi:hypothetical protein